MAPVDRAGLAGMGLPFDLGLARLSRCRCRTLPVGTVGLLVPMICSSRAHGSPNGASFSVMCRSPAAARRRQHKAERRVVVVWSLRHLVEHGERTLDQIGVEDEDRLEAQDVLRQRLVGGDESRMALPRSGEFSLTTAFKVAALSLPLSNRRRRSGSASTRLSDSSARFLENVPSSPCLSIWVCRTDVKSWISARVTSMLSSAAWMNSDEVSRIVTGPGRCPRTPGRAHRPRCGGCRC